MCGYPSVVVLHIRLGENRAAVGDMNDRVRARKRDVMPEKAFERMFRGERGDAADSRSRLGMSSGAGSGSDSYGGRPEVLSGRLENALEAGARCVSGPCGV